MAMQITKANAREALNKLETLKKRLHGLQAKAEETTRKVVRTTEVGGAAFAMGLIQGRTGGVEFLGVPLELGAGVGLNIFGMMGIAGEYSEHVQNLGDGCIAAYACTLGKGVGVTMREKALAASKEGSGSGSGSLPNQGSPASIAAKGDHLTPEEIAALAHHQ